MEALVKGRKAPEIESVRKFWICWICAWLLSSDWMEGVEVDGEVVSGVDSAGVEVAWCGCEEIGEGEEESIILMASREVVLSETPKRRSVSAI